MFQEAAYMTAPSGTFPARGVKGYLRYLMKTSLSICLACALAVVGVCGMPSEQVDTGCREAREILERQISALNA
jgi:hypothetical protein